MITPTVTEIPRRLDAVGRDTFIDGAGPVPNSRPRSRPTATRTLRVVGRLPLAAQPAASSGLRAVTLTRAA
jgi:hypothetical protein